MLKAAQLATFEPGPDSGKQIQQRHFIQGMEEVIGARSIMSQSLYEARDRQLAQVQQSDQVRWAVLLSGAALVTALVALIAALAG